jgi:tRNA-binding protein
MTQISYEDFENIEVHVGRIIKVEELPQARKTAYKSWIYFGDLGMKKFSVQITKLYQEEDLINRLILAVTNFAPR